MACSQLVCWTVTGLIVGLPTIGWGQGTGVPLRRPIAAGVQPAGGDARLARPAPQNAAPQGAAGDGGKVLPVGWQQLQPCDASPRLQAILDAWEAESGKIQTLAGEHERYVYNITFETATVASGKFFYAAPDRGRIDLEGVPPGKIDFGPTGPKKGASGVPFTYKADRNEIWVCTGKEVVTAVELDKTFQAFPLPPDMQGKNIINGPLPFLFGMKADEARRRFDLQLVNEDANYATIRAIPRTQLDSQNYGKATIMLDKSRYLPFAVQLIDLAGTTETVFKFVPNKMAVNSPSFWGFFVRFGIKNDPFQPEFHKQGYRQVQQRVVEQASGEVRK
jgi:TIGR03009 family protein